ncbi:MAG: hypothetical protein WD793_05325 [Steroidobacteraceae bacterium]
MYLDAAQLALLIEDLAGIEGGIPKLKADGAAPDRVQGTRARWMPARPVELATLTRQAFSRLDEPWVA